MNETIKRIFLWLVMGAILVVVFNFLGPRRDNVQEINYSTFLNEVRQGNVSAVTITDQNMSGVMESNETFTTRLPASDNSELMKELAEKGVTIEVKPSGQPTLMHLLNLLPWIILIGIWVYVLRQRAGSDKGFFGRARLFGKDQEKVTCSECGKEIK